MKLPAVRVELARLDWLEALAESDAAFSARFGIAVVDGWVGFPESLPYAVDGARLYSEDPWGTHLFFDGTDGALVGFGGWKGAPVDGAAELGYAIAPARQGRGLATAVVTTLLERARSAGVVTVVAHTLAEPNASTAVLAKTGFRRVAELEDDDEGAIWRWERSLAAS
jgi:RimJ/RimL family protein N-acetyltransferase